MTSPGANTPFVAIACGGTGGHLFPGLAVAEQLQKRGCAVALLVSPKDVDQEAVKSARGMEIVTLPAVALQNRNHLSFARSFWQSWRASRNFFRSRPPHAVLAMGGFTSAPPILAAGKFGAKAFLHESNTIPGRANRFLARFVNEAFVGFPAAAARLRARKVTTTGTPVRPQFQPGDPAPCRAAFQLESNRPTILVMGGSQGASGINDMILSALPLLGNRTSAWQWLHLTGPGDVEKVEQAYAARGFKAVVKPFLAEMDLVLGAATIAVSRAGASSLAEIAAVRLPALLVPYPTAADNHQFYNARAFEATGAARLLEQKNATPEKVAALLCELVEGPAARAKIQAALAQWHAPKAAEQIAESILSACWSSSFSLPAKDRPKPELRQTRGQGCPRSDAVERQDFSAAGTLFWNDR
ncbi:MAG: undecaprenyldiphospho-muramoylpentapeptide beta-N-acetylglucosaminyltransferase [Verrucomicrobiota bacterium]|jgi:UDP-N-acetylglucosamine--N-acetylmuramyl-(pentapeptide) pyrophosphoryl-undecaprenol N-acetylglucosamine transferase